MIERKQKGSVGRTAQNDDGSCEFHATWVWRVVVWTYGGTRKAGALHITLENQHALEHNAASSTRAEAVIITVAKTNGSNKVSLFVFVYLLAALKEQQNFCTSLFLSVCVLQEVLFRCY